MTISNLNFYRRNRTPGMIHGTDLVSYMINSNIGLFGGGVAASELSVVDRYNFSDNTVGSGLNLSAAKKELSALSNKSYVLFAGGVSSEQRLKTTQIQDYTSMTTQAKTNLNNSRSNMAGVSNNTLGIFGGGYLSAATNTTEKYQYSNDSVSSGTNLLETRDRKSVV